MWHEMAVVIGGFVVSSFGLIRYSLGQHRSMADRFVAFLEAALLRHEVTNARFADAVEAISEETRHSAAILKRLAKRMEV